jgi:D-glycero-D-manno-heptose 1,7-bisphosphate phosphatase
VVLKMAKILFVGCDGTIRRPKSGGVFIESPDDQEIIPGADKAINHAVSEGFMVIGITNQGGVAAGKKSLESCLAEQRFTLRLFPSLAAIYFCPDFEGSRVFAVGRGGDFVDHDFSRTDFFDSFRKPGIGMLQYACSDMFGSSLSPDSFMVGDRPEDQECAKAAGIDFMPADIWRDRFLLPPDLGAEKGVYIV